MSPPPDTLRECLAAECPGRNLRSVRFRTCETAKCPVSHLRNVRNAKCPISSFRNIREMRSVRFRTCECTIQIVPAPEHFACTVHARERARPRTCARTSTFIPQRLLVNTECILYTGTLYYGYVVGGGRCETMYANSGACCTVRARRFG